MIATLAIAIAVVLAWVQFSQTPPERPDYEFTVSLPEASRLHTLSLSPDGRHLAVAVRGGESNSPLLVRSLDSVELRELAGTEGARYPFWSPDSRYIGFFAQGKLKKIALSGGPAQSLCDAPNGRGGSWNEDGLIIFAPNPYGGFKHVSTGGGEPVPLRTGDPSQAQISRRFPHFLPDGRHFLYLDRSPRGDEESGIFLGSIDGQSRRRLLSDQSNVIYVPGATTDEGFILFVREGSLMAQPFDAAGLEFAGDLFPLVEAVGRAANTRNHGFSASNNGTVVYAGQGTTDQAQLAWFNREGSEIDRIGKPQSIMMLDLSPDEKKIALSVRDDFPADIWLYELARGGMSRFTSDPQTDYFPAWSPDGDFIAFSSDRDGTFTVYQKSAGGAGEAEALLTPEQRGLASYGSAWSQDGRFLLYTASGPNASLDLWVFPLDGGQEAFPFLATEFREADGRFSPDARWIAYDGNQSGQSEVYIRPVPEADREWMVSTEGGSRPRWRADGKELYYIAPDRTLVAVPIEAGEAIKAGVPQPLFPTRIRSTNLGTHASAYDVTSDGQRFLIANQTEESRAQTLTVITNWRSKVQN